MWWPRHGRCPPPNPSPVICHIAIRHLAAKCAMVPSPVRPQALGTRPHRPRDPALIIATMAFWRRRRGAPSRRNPHRGQGYPPRRNAVARTAVARRVRAWRCRGGVNGGGRGVSGIGVVRKDFAAPGGDACASAFGARPPRLRGGCRLRDSWIGYQGTTACCVLGDSINS